ncbi:MAG TPA: OmpA family protein [Polyangiales bacterium]|nr:OmpA family protein [Polyangiales bacterium]
MLASLGCAHTPPKELVDARDAYKRASSGIAAEQAPADLHTADNALQEAELSFEKDGDSEHARDLAYVATRKAQLAEVRGRVLQSQNELDRLEAETQSQQRADLQNLRGKYETQQQQLAASQAALEDAKRRADQAAADLARIASVKQEPRGTVITLSGELLFTSGSADLMPGAEAKLSQVARALTQQDKSARITVEGHTDSQGSDEFNLDLSTRRADAVRSYLSSHGVAGDRIGARGMGEAQPVGSNDTPQGRANNRRVEIVVEPPKAASSPT